MPRQPRLDIPGLLHHVIARGIERTEIFRDDRDRGAFVERLGELVPAAGTKLYAWGLLPNHFHLVLKPGERGLAWLMRRLMTSHAVRFNLRHGRVGHLFQNRYKSFVVEEEPHFLELVRYVALNPVRAGLVHSQEELDRYPWNGHALIVGRRRVEWQEADDVLARFAGRRREAIARYREFVVAGWAQGRRQDLVGGGFLRSAGGPGGVTRRRREGGEAADERVLGSGAFVEAVVWGAREQGRPATPRRGWEEILGEVAEKWGLESSRVVGSSRERVVCRARREFLLRSRSEGGMSMAALARLCAMNPASVTRAIDLARKESSAQDAVAAARCLEGGERLDAPGAAYGEAEMRSAQETPVSGRSTCSATT
jgi:REP element-mobilizing transposase RayT